MGNCMNCGQQTFPAYIHVPRGPGKCDLWKPRVWAKARRTRPR